MSLKLSKSDCISPFGTFNSLPQAWWKSNFFGTQACFVGLFNRIASSMSCVDPTQCSRWKLHYLLRRLLGCWVGKWYDIRVGTMPNLSWVNKMVAFLWHWQPGCGMLPMHQPKPAATFACVVSCFLPFWATARQVPQGPFLRCDSSKHPHDRGKPRMKDPYYRGIQIWRGNRPAYVWLIWWRFRNSWICYVQSRCIHTQHSWPSWQVVSDLDLLAGPWLVDLKHWHCLV